MGVLFFNSSILLPLLKDASLVTFHSLQYHSFHLSISAVLHQISRKFPAMKGRDQFPLIDIRTIEISYKMMISEIFDCNQQLLLPYIFQYR